jgi:hypothetical protein
MKVKYKTTRETAAILREMAGNIGSSDDSLVRAGGGGIVQRLKAQRARAVEEFMTGEVEVTEPTSAAVMRAFQNCRVFRSKTIDRFAPTIEIEMV